MPVRRRANMLSSLGTAAGGTMKLLTIIGTRPEAVKMAPVLRALQERTGVTSRLCTTGQHPELCDGPLRFFGLCADISLAVMEPGQSLNRLVGRTMLALDEVLEAERPDRVIVHGDTAAARAAAEAAVNRRIPVAHVEAGLRTYRADNPWPEEHYRRAIDDLSDQLFAPTAGAADNLASERKSGAIFVTGNSGVDALHWVLGRLASDGALRKECDAALPPISDRPLVLATIHRRESIGAGVAGVCEALARISRSGLAEVAVPVHTNPEVSAAVRSALRGEERVHLLPPLSHAAMVRLMQRAALIVTDSGGVQEEAPTLGKPVLVLREVTERPEAVEAGIAVLAGTCPERIVAETETALQSIGSRAVRPVVANPYGDGRAAARIVAGLLDEPFRAFGSAAPESGGVPLRIAV